ncbi:9222_t:CDS:2, partial [Ambispora gerdemannii]
MALSAYAWTSLPVYPATSILRPYGSALWPMFGRGASWDNHYDSFIMAYNMAFYHYTSDFKDEIDPKDWNVLICLRYLKDRILFTSDSKQEILDSFVKVFKKINEFTFVHAEALEIQQINKKRKIEENIDEVNTSEKSDNLHEATAILNKGNGEQSFYKEVKKSNNPFWYKGNILPDGTKIEKQNRLNLIPSDDFFQETDDDEDIPPEQSFISASSGSKIWTLLSGRNVGDIYASKISENAIEKAILRYGASNIIDLSAHMKEWFCIDDRKFITKNYESMLRVPELAAEESSFVSKIEDVWVLFFINLTSCAYIVEGLSKNLKVYSIWGESFCPLSRSTDYTKGRKCDVRFLSALRVDVGEWEFSAKAIANKIIGDRCRSARINQSILNGLLEYDLNDKQVKNIQVPFLQFGGTSEQLKLKTAINVIKLVM